MRLAWSACAQLLPPVYSVNVTNATAWNIKPYYASCAFKISFVICKSQPTHRYSTFVFTHITLIVLILLTAHYNIQVVWMTQLRIFLHKKLIFIIVCCVWKWRYNNTKYQNEVLEEEDKLKTTLRNPVINCSTLFVAWPACGNFEYDRWWVNLWPCLGLWWLQLRQMFPYKLLKFSDLNKCLDTDTNWIQTRGGKRSFRFCLSASAGGEKVAA